MAKTKKAGTLPKRRLRQAQAFNAVAGIPVSVYAALDLPHPLELFGAGFKVHISTHFTFNPDTVSRAVCDLSLDAGMRKWAGDAYQMLRKLSYVAAGKHKLSGTTIRVITRRLAPFVPEEAALRALTGKDSPAQPRSDWQTFLDGMQNGSDETLKDFCRCLAACDTHALHVRSLAVAGQPDAAIAHVASLLRADIAAWVNRPGFELTPRSWTVGPADQAAFLSRYSTGLSPRSPSLIRLWL